MIETYRFSDSQAAIVKEWIDALRSGKYQQGTRKLRGINNDYCCLGVLCDMYVRQHPNSARWTLGEGDDRWELHMADLLPPGIVTNWFNSTIPHPVIISFYRFLARENDGTNGSFDRIAELLEYVLQNGFAFDSYFHVAYLGPNH